MRIQQILIRIIAAMTLSVIISVQAADPDPAPDLTPVGRDFSASAALLQLKTFAHLFGDDQQQAPLLVRQNTDRKQSIKLLDLAALHSNNSHWYNSELDLIIQASDPILQMIYNLHATQTDCADSEAPCLSQQALTQKLLGKIYNDIQKNSLTPENLPPSLSVRALLDPREFNRATHELGTSSYAPNLSVETGSQQAANEFIRYLTHSAVNFPQDEEFIESVNSGNLKGEALAEAAKYLGERFSYAAQASIALDNLTYLLEKRIPDSAENNSLAEEEFLTVIQEDSQQFKQDLKNMPQKEVLENIALLLNEQLKQAYIRGQENDRLLLTSSALALLKLQELKMQIIYDTSLITDSSQKGLID